MSVIGILSGVIFFIILLNTVTLGISNKWLRIAIKDAATGREYKVLFLAVVGLFGALSTPQAGFAILALGCGAHWGSTVWKIQKTVEAANMEAKLMNQRNLDALREPGDWRP